MLYILPMAMARIIYIYECGMYRIVSFTTARAIRIKLFPDGFLLLQSLKFPPVWVSAHLHSNPVTWEFGLNGFTPTQLEPNPVAHALRWHANCLSLRFCSDSCLHKHSIEWKIIEIDSMTLIRQSQRLVSPPIKLGNIRLNQWELYSQITTEKLHSF